MKLIMNTNLVDWKDIQKLAFWGSIKLRIIADVKFIPNAMCKGFTSLKISLAKNMFVKPMNNGTNKPSRNQILEYMLLSVLVGASKSMIAEKPKDTPNNLKKFICSNLIINAIMYAQNGIKANRIDMVPALKLVADRYRM